MRCDLRSLEPRPYSTLLELQGELQGAALTSAAATYVWWWSLSRNAKVQHAGRVLVSILLLFSVCVASTLNC